jgi:transposase
VKDPDSVEFFRRPLKPKHKQYEALRAYYLEDLSQQEAAERAGYSLYTFQALTSRFQRGEIDFFPEPTPGPGRRRVPDLVQERMVSLREAELSIYDIKEVLEEEGFETSLQTINRILTNAGFSKLPRRTKKEMGLTDKGTLVPPASAGLDFDDLSEHSFECQVGGVFYFIPYIIETGLHELLLDTPFPESGRLSKTNSVLSMLALKLMGHERLSRVTNYGLDTGLGFFAGLNVPPKTTATSTYSYRVDKDAVDAFLERFVAGMAGRYPQYYQGETINLDFHSIPHYGEMSMMDDNWVGSKHQRLKSALTLFAQDGESRMLLYEDADIRSEEASGAVMGFVDRWLRVRGIIDQTLVFDSKLTTYERLEELDSMGVRFITLRRRGKNLIEDAEELPEEAWKRVDLKKAKRKHNRFNIAESVITLPRTHLRVRQLIFEGHGREQPTFLITNNFDIPMETLALHYSNRWLIENKFSELVDFFKLNALSSPLMVRIYFDVALTVVADTLYKLLARDLRRFEDCTPKTLFGDFINCGCRGEVVGNEVIIRMKKKATTPVLKSMDRFRRSWPVPWWGGKEVRYEWVA